MVTPRVHAIPYKKCVYNEHGKCMRCGRMRGWRVSFWNRRRGQKSDCGGRQ